jgi:hypothetical protein
VLFQSHSRGLVTDRGVQGGETLAQLRVAYNDVWIFPEPDVADAIAADAGFFFIGFGPSGPFGSFRTTSSGDSHFDVISSVEAGHRCHF